MQCKYELCSNEAKGSGAYCSNSCRAKESRRNRTSATLEAQQTYDPCSNLQEVGRHDELQIDDYGDIVHGRVIYTDSEDIKSLSRVDLMNAIKSYPHDQWVGSVEIKELMRRLRVWSVEKLEGLGYFIPAWKVSA